MVCPSNGQAYFLQFDVWHLISSCYSPFCHSEAIQNCFFEANGLWIWGKTWFPTKGIHPHTGGRDCTRNRNWPTLLVLFKFWTLKNTEILGVCWYLYWSMTSFTLFLVFAKYYNPENNPYPLILQFAEFMVKFISFHFTFGIKFIHVTAFFVILKQLRIAFKANKLWIPRLRQDSGPNWWYAPICDVEIVHAKENGPLCLSLTG